MLAAIVVVVEKDTESDIFFLSLTELRDLSVLARA